LSRAYRVTDTNTRSLFFNPTQSGKSPPWIGRYLDEGLSLPQIGALVNRDPSTVGYWVQKHGLAANGRDRYAPRGGLTREQLKPLVDRGLSQAQIARELDVGVSTVRHWLKKHGLETKAFRRRRRRAEAAISAGHTSFIAECARHGWTQFVVYKDGRSRCKQCAKEAVVRRRRRVKQILMDEAGGACNLRVCEVSGRLAVPPPPADCQGVFR
jgi:transposase